MRNHAIRPHCTHHLLEKLSYDLTQSDEEGALSVKRFASLVDDDRHDERFAATERGRCHRHSDKHPKGSDR